MAWTKDDTTLAPKVVYTPGAGENPCITRLIYDPDAPALRKFVVEMSGISAENQSLEDVESVLGIS